MLPKKTGFPEESELVLCTITSVQHHSVFVRIEDYDISGMIHISEVAPGRIRNMHDYVAEGKSVVCKVLRVNRERGHVDLSLRRVSDSQHRKKINEVKKEKLSEKIVEAVATNLNQKPAELYKQISEKAREHYYLLFECFSEIARGTFDVKELNLPRNVETELSKIIKDRLKPEVYVYRGTLRLTSFEPNGLETIRETLKQASDKGAKVRYLGGGAYSVSVSAPDHKEARNALDESAQAALDFIKSKKGSGSFEEAKA